MSIESVFVGEDGRLLRDYVEMLDLDYVSSEWSHRSPFKNEDWRHQREGKQLWWDSYVIQCASLAAARLVLPLLKNEGRAHRFVLIVNEVAAHGDQTSTANALCSRSLNRIFRLQSGQSAVQVQGDKWVNVHAALLAALLGISGNVSALSLGGLRVGITDASQSAWTAGDPLSMLMTDPLLTPAHDDIFSVDVIVGKPEIEAVHGRASPLLFDPPTDMLPPVDIGEFSPRGYLTYTTGGTMDLKTVLNDELAELDGAGLRKLRELDYIRIDGSNFSGQSRDLARQMSQLAMAGIPMLTTSMDGHVQTLLGARILSRLAAFRADDDACLRESKSIDMRRDAHDIFGPHGRWNQILESKKKPRYEDESVSVILATRRPDKVSFALGQLARQSWSNLEAVLVLHGIDASTPEVRVAVDRYPGEVVVREVTRETIFGDVLNMGVEVSSGRILSKMDDDDWYGKHHIRDLVHARRHSKAELVGTQVEFVYLESLDITTRRPPAGERFSDHVAGGTMMISKEDLRTVGNWRPVHRAVDRCLLQAVQNSGGAIYRGHGQNYLMHRRGSVDTAGDHTWNPGDGSFLQNVAEQWDGFVPPPQIAIHSYRHIRSTRTPELRSYFSTVDNTNNANSIHQTH